MFIKPIDPEIRQALREVHFFINGYLEGMEMAVAFDLPERWEGLDPTHLDALDCVLKYLDESADDGKESHE